MNIKKLNIFLKDYRKFIPVSEQPSGDDLFLAILHIVLTADGVDNFQQVQHALLHLVCHRTVWIIFLF